MTIKVIDEHSNAVENANVRIRFQLSTHSSINYNGILKEYTKSDGILFRLQHHLTVMLVLYHKIGYYEIGGTYDFKIKRAFRWEPWNPEIAVVLRKIEKPMAMYARDTNESRMEIPVIGKEVGFDLIAFDWVKPYGKGGHSDFIFKLNKRFVSWNDYDSNLALTFPNEYDGIQLINNNLLTVC